ncbi:hypothetical protein H7U19_05995 [Hyunsoonleella sp. SJ7]|uniref:LVIVD repeat-containing protein n=1 Tax=Hyunsoonleella aquatilis TaxID=2762758 RepID=A0A923HBC6_9FLAO|nr:hypothetical protein [Hyunsoonleella aquatilis]MBC3757946.1 hypothetical protein [Hyunsoonleella aquatilis]
MKLKFAICVFFIAFTCISCDSNDDENLDLVTVATPEIMSKSQFRKSVDILPPQPIQTPGKIYAYSDYLFVNDINKGVHIIDNTNPKFPKAIKYLTIPGNEDISVKNNFLYADSATDLVVFDLSDINGIKMVERLEDVFERYNYNVPLEAEATDWAEFNYETDIIVGWTTKQERREDVEELLWIDVAFDGSPRVLESTNTVGTGGSLARFQIVDKYLYTVGSYSMAIFDIEDLANPTLEATQSAGWNIETMFAADNYLYLGSVNGMYIYDLKNPASPEYVSEFVHWEGCDPVVVDGDYAYLTLRGGNLCGQLESVLEVIDISDKGNPTLAKRYTLENPYGLGVKGNMLYVCDGTAGLKLFKRETPVELNMVRNLKNIQATDVIPLENSLIMIGDNTLYQYKYMANNVGLISSFRLN